jgi:hypothetical protein
MAWRELHELGRADLERLVERKTRFVQAVHRCSWEDARARVLSRISPELQTAAERCGLVLEPNRTTTREAATMSVHSHQMTRQEAERQLDLACAETRRANPKMTKEQAYDAMLKTPEGLRLKRAYNDAPVEDAQAPTSRPSGEVALAQQCGDATLSAAAKALDDATTKMQSRLPVGTTRAVAMDLALKEAPELYSRFTGAQDAVRRRDEQQRDKAHEENLQRELSRRQQERGGW